MYKSALEADMCTLDQSRWPPPNCATWTLGSRDLMVPVHLACTVKVACRRRMRQVRTALTCLLLRTVTRSEKTFESGQRVQESCFIA